MGHLPDVGTGWSGVPTPYWEYPQAVRSWWLFPAFPTQPALFPGLGESHSPWFSML